MGGGRRGEESGGEKKVECERIVQKESKSMSKRSKRISE